jgi:hypothetical protein
MSALRLMHAINHITLHASPPDIRQQIMQGQVHHVIDIVQTRLRNSRLCDQLLFQLRCQEFVEQLRTGHGDPLSFARTYLQPYHASDHSAAELQVWQWQSVS